MVKSDSFHWKIDIESVQSIEPTNNPISSPELSLDRLAIHYGQGKQLLVSTKDKEGFLKALGRDKEN